VHVVSGAADDAGGARQLHGKGQVCNNNNREILCLWLHTHSPVVPVMKENEHFMGTF
jgi:hypothetical protein